MSNVRRLRVSDRVFFVTVNLQRGQTPLGERELAMLLDTLAASRRRLGFALCGYVLMPDHWHALIWPQCPLTISRVIQDVKYASARRINGLRGTRRKLWEHQFWDRFVRNARELGARLEYIHMNPVKRELVSRPEDWKWSSYNNFALEKSRVAACPIQIDYTHLPESYRG